MDEGQSPNTRMVMGQIKQSIVEKRRVSRYQKSMRKLVLESKFEMEPESVIKPSSSLSLTNITLSKQMSKMNFVPEARLLIFYILAMFIIEDFQKGLEFTMLDFSEIESSPQFTALLLRFQAMFILKQQQISSSKLLPNLEVGLTVSQMALKLLKKDQNRS